MPTGFWVGAAIGFVLGLVFKQCPDETEEAYKKGMKAAYTELSSSRKYSKPLQAIIDAASKEKDKGGKK